MNAPPPFLGGQGRTARSIRDTGGHLGWLLVLAAALVALAVLRQVSK